MNVRGRDKRGARDKRKGRRSEVESGMLNNLGALRYAGRFFYDRKKKEGREKK